MVLFVLSGKQSVIALNTACWKTGVLETGKDACYTLHSNNRINPVMSWTNVPSFCIVSPLLKLQSLISATENDDPTLVFHLV